MAIEESRRETGGQEEVSMGRPSRLRVLWGRGWGAVFSWTSVQTGGRSVSAWSTPCVRRDCCLPLLSEMLLVHEARPLSAPAVGDAAGAARSLLLSGLVGREGDGIELVRTHVFWVPSRCPRAPRIPRLGARARPVWSPTCWVSGPPRGDR